MKLRKRRIYFYHLGAFEAVLRVLVIIILCAFLLFVLWGFLLK